MNICVSSVMYIILWRSPLLFIVSGSTNRKLKNSEHSDHGKDIGLKNESISK